eukprot:gnl/TRDRNA2_/TRDRNA2_129858_c0_seq1.p1 gnl/TRDRNA2_/TRDRNA2_129858_c0~~gnl/TRDRNA2_/TRDRNA2_129858_c0_seq1.p1  ORF type:complete len:344 (-),score=54.09 gnl/TRDRNA2_/TRDRNA2_129858_c0_seq1:209-1207(-)
MGVDVRVIGKVLIFFIGATCYSLLNILSQLSKEADGSYAYSMPSVVLNAEFVKLCLSLLFLFGEQRSLLGTVQAAVLRSPHMWLLSSLPSVLYSVNNNLDMLNNQHMDPGTEQVLVQLKVLTTGLAWWLVFRSPLGRRKWLALFLLFLGAVAAGWPKSGKTEGKRMFIDMVGIFLVIAYVWISAIAGVYNEWLYKGPGKDMSIHVCNFRLYAIGCCCNFSAHFASSPHGWEGGLLGVLGGMFHGYNVYTWALVATYSLMGLILSQVMKHLDSIVKLFISGTSMYITAVLSWAIFGYTPAFTFVIGLLLVSFALALFHYEKISTFFFVDKKKE